MRAIKHSIVLPTLFVLGAAAVGADEGMWTLHDFPAAAVEESVGAEIGPEWLDRGG